MYQKKTIQYWGEILLLGVVSPAKPDAVNISVKVGLPLYIIMNT